jgi:hypothetical protein
LAFFMAVWASAPAAAQPQPRTLAVPATSSWQHAATGMILPPTATDLKRGSIVDRTAAEQDVSTDYRDAAGSVLASVYLYQTMLPNPAIWFDRAVAAVYLQPMFGLAGVPPPEPTAFARPGATTASGLRTTIALNSGPAKSTAIAVAPLGRWLLKVRMSSATLTATELDARLDAFIAALRWPVEGKSVQAAEAIRPCPAPLKLKRAKRVREDMANSLLDALAGSFEPAVPERDEAPQRSYCREGSGMGQYGVYRADAATDSYVIALGDAGVAVSAGPSLGAFLTGGKRRIVLTLLDRNTSSAVGSFDRLPPPEQAIRVALGTAPSVSATTED